MSLGIKTDNVTEVMIGGGWYKVRIYPKSSESAGKSTFTLDAYEFIEDGRRIGGGDEDESGISATGFVFTSVDGDIIIGPLNSIQAVKVK